METERIVDPIGGLWIGSIRTLLLKQEQTRHARDLDLTYSMLSRPALLVPPHAHLKYWFIDPSISG